MSLEKVNLQLYNDVKNALEDEYRYDRIERYVLSQVLAAAEKNKPTEEVFIKSAKEALKRHTSNHSQVAA
jgi:HEPN domain-containing protein